MTLANANDSFPSHDEITDIGFLPNNLDIMITEDLDNYILYSNFLPCNNNNNNDTVNNTVTNQNFKNDLQISLRNFDFSSIYNDINKLYSFKSFNRYHKSSFHFKQVREYLIYLRKDAISQGNAESYSKLWLKISQRMKSLHGRLMIVVEIGSTFFIV